MIYRQCEDLVDSRVSHTTSQIGHQEGSNPEQKNYEVQSSPQKKLEQSKSIKSHKYHSAEEIIDGIRDTLSKESIF